MHEQKWSSQFVRKDPHSILDLLRKVKATISPFPLTMKIHAALKLPAMTPKEIGIYKIILASLPYRKELNIFEYGSGFSTLYFAKFLKKRNIPFHIFSIDNNFEWHRRVQDQVNRSGFQDEITLLISEFPPFWEKEGWDWNAVPECGRFAPKTEAELEYISAPSRTGRKFDFISVDARFRRLCLLSALTCLSENGVVVLHDAQKPHYHQPIALYRISRFLDGGTHYPFERRIWKIWIGTSGDRLPL